MKTQTIKMTIPEIDLNQLSISCVERTLSKNYELHFHDLHELEFIVSGKCIHYINNTPIECVAGSIVFMTPMDMHRIVIIEPAKIINLNFKMNCIDKELQSLCNKSMFAHGFSDTYIKLLVNEFNNNLKYNLFFQKYLLNSLLTQLARHAEVSDNTTNNNTALEIARYIQQHYTEAITLNTLSSVFGYTPNYLSNQFHKTIGKTIKQFILDTRLERAAKLLLTTSDSVTNICFATGFTSLSNFLRAFNSKYNKSPNSYRKNIQKE